MTAEDTATMAHALVLRSCAESGVPVKVTDPAAIARVACALVATTTTTTTETISAA